MDRPRRSEGEMLIRKLFEEVWTDGDVEQAAAMIDEHYQTDPPTTVTVSGSPGFTFLSGLEAFRVQVERLRGDYDSFRLAVVDQWSGNNTIVSLLQASGISKTETFTNRGGTETPKKLSSLVVGVCDVTGNKVKRITLFWPTGPELH